MVDTVSTPAWGARLATALHTTRSIIFASRRGRPTTLPPGAISRPHSFRRASGRPPFRSPCGLAQIYGACSVPGSLIRPRLITDTSRHNRHNSSSRIRLRSCLSASSGNSYQGAAGLIIGTAITVYGRERLSCSVKEPSRCKTTKASIICGSKFRDASCK